MFYQKHWNGFEVKKLHNTKIVLPDYLENREAYGKRLLSIICMPDFLSTAFVCGTLYSKKCLGSYSQFPFLGFNLGSVIVFRILPNV
jgi:hypothetical protein